MGSILSRTGRLQRYEYNSGRQEEGLRVTTIEGIRFVHGIGVNSQGILTGPGESETSQGTKETSEAEGSQVGCKSPMKVWSK